LAWCIAQGVLREGLVSGGVGTDLSVSSRSSLSTNKQRIVLQKKHGMAWHDIMDRMDDKAKRASERIGLQIWGIFLHLLYCVD